MESWFLWSQNSRIQDLQFRDEHGSGYLVDVRGFKLDKAFDKSLNLKTRKQKYLISRNKFWMQYWLKFVYKNFVHL